MSKKFAVCFSGYPRFVRQQFKSIKENFLDGLGDYDVYAKFQWKDDYENIQIHHEYDDKFEVNELEDFKELYADKLKKIEVIEPYKFDFEFSDQCAEGDMFLSREQAKDVGYRMKCQFQGIADCIDIIDNIEDYDYVVRMRTDVTFMSEIEMKDLDTDVIMNQDGFVAGRDRPWSDWFFISPIKDVQFFHDMAKIEEHFSEGVRHTHNVLAEVGRKYGMEYFEFYVRTPTATGGDIGTPFKKQTSKYTVIAR